jgi:carbon-monoxide dehydrogenase iron sulfur subunit
MRRILLHPERCLGCLACEAACVAVHKLPGAPLTTEVIMQTFSRAALRTTRIWVAAAPDGYAPIPVNCRHCLEPACVSVCSIGALKQEGANGAVINQEERCAGCWMCVMVCPFGGVDKCGKIALKCDLCPGRAVPACVEACPNDALEWVEVEPLAAQKRTRLAGLVAGGKPTCAT